MISTSSSLSGHMLVVSSYIGLESHNSNPRPDSAAALRKQLEAATSAAGHSVLLRLLQG
jgi:hypothetical protein